MAVTVRIPTALRALTNGETTVTTAPGTVADVLASLEESYPGFADVLFDSKGILRPFVALFIGPDDIRMLDGQSTDVDEGSTLTIMSAVAGG